MQITLDNDLIWLISMINASDIAYDKQHRLTTTRITSQVCRRWREVVLRSSAMWGRLVLLRTGQSREWMEEVLRRAGDSSLLWVEFNPEEAMPFEDLLFGVLQKFHRIEVLCITRNSYRAQDRLCEKIWDTLTMPAPALRSFRFVDSYLHQFEWSMSLGKMPENLFAGRAPRLRDFQCLGYFPTYNERWLSDLEILYFSAQSVDEIRNVQERAPRLRSLGIKCTRNCFSPSNNAHFDDVALMSINLLPRLSCIQARMPLAIFTALWSTPSKPLEKTSTILVINIDNGHVNEGDKAKFLQALSYFFHNRNFCIENAPNSEETSGGLTFTARKLTFSAVRKVASGKADILYLSFVCIPITPIEINMIQFLVTCLAPYMRNITDIALSDKDGTSTNYIPLDALGDALVRMTMVTTICMNSKFFQICDGIEESRQEVLFPALKTFECDHNLSSESFHYGMSEYKELLLRFCQRRVVIGRNLPFIHASVVSPDSIHGICDDLNAISGEQICWSAHERGFKEWELKWEHV